MEETIGYRAPIKSKREKNILEGYDAMRLTQGEIGFWANKEKEVDKNRKVLYVLPDRTDCVYLVFDCIYCCRICIL